MALRRSAETLWNHFSSVLSEEIARSAAAKEEPDLEPSIETLEITKLLYGLAVETALKAWIVERSPEKVEIRVVLDGSGNPKHAELRTVGVPTASGHNILALAEAAGLFGGDFNAAIPTPEDERALRNIFRDLGEVVLWRGRYPVPLASAAPLQLDPKVHPRALAYHMRDWLDPVLDALLSSEA